MAEEGSVFSNLKSERNQNEVCVIRIRATQHKPIFPLIQIDSHLNVVPGRPSEQRRIDGCQLTHRPVGQVVRSSKFVICQAG